MNNGYLYYAVIGERHTREQPYGVVRRRPFPTGGGYDEIFSRGSSWKPTAVMREAEFGDSRFDFVEIDEAEAARLVAYFRKWQEEHAQPGS